MATDLIKLSAPAKKGFWEIPICYEDDYLLALEKPPLLLSSPDRYDPSRPNLMKLLHHGIERRASWARERNLQYLMNAHRLDFETSGVFLLAKSRSVLVALADLFGSEKPVKTYIALVQGTPKEESFAVDARIAAHPARPGLMRIDEKAGKRSRTLFRFREKFAGFTLLECQPLTGRTHQIRVHLKYAGHSIVGDLLYGGGSLLLSSLKPQYRLKPDKIERPLIAHTALHAEKLELIHPVTSEPVTISSKWPKDFDVAVKYLRRYAAAGFA